ncbi:very short patch repair endonuclease [Microvirga sesbaniae]|uniref:very short patch repair endonuclease n=1 Tax=Microvirga sesbaniae TaxID=681392 RepID=UPI0021C94E37|nr:very short patch repair endonuclease [Microvirga sp. HBU67692]
MDILTPEKRSAHMSRIRSKNTRPEIAVRALAHSLGYRFRLHRRDLPGTPDLVFPSRRKVIFVHGCFWHGHEGCRCGRLPKTRTEFWQKKIEGNRHRDEQAIRTLSDAGWSSLVIWGCQTKDRASLTEILSNFLGPKGRGGPQTEAVGRTS